MTPEKPSIILITGVMAAGKSTIAQAVAERLPQSVHLRGDVFRRMIVNGRIEITPEWTESALEQLRLRYRLAAMAADLYCAAGFTVVYQDVILGALLQEVIDMLGDQWARYVIVLRPSIDVITQREAGRAKVGYGGGWTPANLDQELESNTPRVGLWLDTSALTVEETVDTLLAQLGKAAVT